MKTLGSTHGNKLTNALKPNTWREGLVIIYPFHLAEPLSHHPYFDFLYCPIKKKSWFWTPTLISQLSFSLALVHIAATFVCKRRHYPKPLKLWWTKTYLTYPISRFSNGFVEHWFGTKLHKVFRSRWLLWFILINFDSFWFLLMNFDSFHKPKWQGSASGPINILQISLIKSASICLTATNMKHVAHSSLPPTLFLKRRNYI